MEITYPKPVMSDIDFERPLKKRRFFVEEPEKSDFRSSSPTLQERPPSQNGAANGTDHEDVTQAETKQLDDGALDRATLENVVGETLSPQVVQKLQDLSGGNLERGIYTWESHIIVY